MARFSVLSTHKVYDGLKGKYLSPVFFNITDAQAFATEMEEIVEPLPVINTATNPVSEKDDDIPF